MDTIFVYENSRSPQVLKFDIVFFWMDYEMDFNGS